jgi:hypothetical protein
VAGSAIDVIVPAFRRMKKQLFGPFRLGQWLRLAFVGFLAGEVSSGGEFHSNLPFEFPSGSTQRLPPVLEQTGPIVIAGIALLILLAFIALAAVFLYISSRMRFVLFDGIVNGECRIRESWRRRGGPGYRYFVWQLTLMLFAMAAVILLIGLPIFAAYVYGMFESPFNWVGLIFGGLVLLLLLFLILVTFAVIQLLSKDFVVPQMALEDLTAIEGWRRLWAMMKSEMGSYAGYIGMKIALGLGAAIVVSMVGIIVFLMVLLLVGAFAVAAALGAGAGLTWNPSTIAIAVQFGGFVVLLLLLALSLVSVPSTVFFPTYALYFFAGRYPPLDSLMYSRPPQPTPVAPPS